jgi:hypothetical protein
VKALREDESWAPKVSRKLPCGLIVQGPKRSQLASSLPKTGPDVPE